MAGEPPAASSLLQGAAPACKPSGWMDWVGDPSTVTRSYPEPSLIGRTAEPAEDGFTQEDAVPSAWATSACRWCSTSTAGHVPPQLALVNGALAEVTVDGDTQALPQTLS